MKTISCTVVLYTMISSVIVVIIVVVVVVSIVLYEILSDMLKDYIFKFLHTFISIHLCFWYCSRENSSLRLYVCLMCVANIYLSDMLIPQNPALIFERREGRNLLIRWLSLLAGWDLYDKSILKWWYIYMSWYILCHDRGRIGNWVIVQFHHLR